MGAEPPIRTAEVRPSKVCRFGDSRASDFWPLSNYYPAAVENRHGVWPSIGHLWTEHHLRGPDLRPPFRFQGESGPSADMMEEVRRAGPENAVWRCRCETGMLLLLRLKFGKHHNLADQLRSTRGTLIVYESDDPMWGVGGGRGKNLLGRLLIILREELFAPKVVPAEDAGEDAQA